MLNREIISTALPALNPNDPVHQALGLMADFHVSNLAVVADEKLIGLVAENDLLNVLDESIPLSQLESVFSKIVVHANAHFLEAVQKLNELP